MSDAARRHSEDMLRRRFFAHINPDRQTPADRIAAAVRRPVGASAENIWMRSGPVPSTTVSRVVEEAFAQLMASPTHRKNIVNARYTHLGVGVAAQPELGLRSERRRGLDPADSDHLAAHRAAVRLIDDVIIRDKN